MKKRASCFLLALFLLFALTACGSGTTNSAAGDSTASADTGMAEDTASSTTETDFSAVRANAKLILRADLSLETQSFDESVTGIEKLTQQVGGYIESSSQSGELGARNVNYALRIPQKQFETFLGDIGNLSHVVSENRSAEDVTEQYTDVETRLATQKSKHERLLRLLDQAEKMEDIIALESALADTEYEIDSLSGEKRNYDNLVDFATVSVSLDEVQTLSTVSGGAGFGARLSQAAASGLHGFGTFCRGVAIAVVTVWPIVLLLVIVGAVLLLRRKKKQRSMSVQSTRDGQPTAEEPSSEPGIIPPLPSEHEDPKK